MAARVVTRFAAASLADTLWRKAKASIKPALAELQRVTGRGWELNSFSGLEGNDIHMTLLEAEDPVTRGVGLTVAVDIPLHSGEIEATWEVRGWDSQRKDYRAYASGSQALMAADFDKLSRALHEFVAATAKIAKERDGREGSTEATLMLTILLKSARKYLAELENVTGEAWKQGGVYAPDPNLRTVHFFPRKKSRTYHAVSVHLSYSEATGHQLAWIGQVANSALDDVFKHIEPRDLEDPTKWFKKLEIKSDSV